MKTKFLVLGVVAFFGVAYIGANLVTDLGCCNCKCAKSVVKSEATCSGDNCSCDDKKNKE